MQPVPQISGGPGMRLLWVTKMKIRSQSKDPVIQEAARQGVKLYKIAGEYFTASAPQIAREIGCSPAMARRVAAIHVAGLSGAVVRGELGHWEAYRAAQNPA